MDNFLQPEARILMNIVGIQSMHVPRVAITNKLHITLLSLGVETSADWLSICLLDFVQLIILSSAFTN